jgi:hypothetical protein
MSAWLVRDCSRGAYPIKSANQSSKSFRMTVCLRDPCVPVHLALAIKARADAKLSLRQYRETCAIA